MNTPTQDYRRTAFHQPERLLKGLDAALHGVGGAYRRRAGVLAGLRRQAEQVDALAREYQDLSNHHLQERLLECRAHFRRGGRASADQLVPALAAVREAADREVGLRPFVVQLMGALALHRGYLAEMATGEGKTLTAGLAGVLWAWTRRPCHIITVNDYLVQRDAEWLKPLYHFCGVRVGFVTGMMPPDERRKAYVCDLTYATSKEVTADFLRDGLRVGPLRQPTRRLVRHLLRPAAEGADGLVMRGLHSAIVDEADSVLIDEAVTPLIISTFRANDALREVARLAHELTQPLRPETDYWVNHRYREVELTPVGRAKLAELCAPLPGLWRGPSRRMELVKQALVAREFYQPGKQYIVADSKVVIVDEFTGRQMPQRTWRQGMHQAVEAKEGLPISDPTETVARISFQRYFRFYHRLAGMTGTAREAAAELWQIYRLPVVTLPTHRPCVRVQYPDRVYPSEEAKWEAVVAEIGRMHAEGRPVLVGTRSVMASETLAQQLTEAGLPYKLLNAVRHAEEALIVAVAGEPGRITIATNMAGRGTDIKLGVGVAARGGLHVIATERHESGRVDRQLFGRCARQGDPGSAQALVSVQDELLRRFLPRLVHGQVRRWVKAGAPGAQAAAEAALALAQRNAQRQAYKLRRSVLRTDDWIEESLSFAGSETG
ncbi:MAG: prepilin peptidase [Verrucomicrobia bacterium]|nr:prepilin peptidase [Verrucomicrobiota bacterium]